MITDTCVCPLTLYKLVTRSVCHCTLMKTACLSEGWLLGYSIIASALLECVALLLFFKGIGMNPYPLDPSLSDSPFFSLIYIRVGTLGWIAILGSSVESQDSHKTHLKIPATSFF